MFVPLPVPFVFQRTAPDLNAWRLKSPLALRSNSGKTFFFSSLFSLLHILHVGQTQPCRPAPPCSVPMHLQRGELSARTPTYTRTHTHTHAHLRLLFEGLNRVLYTCGAVVQIKEAFPSALECPDCLKMSCVKCPFLLSVLWSDAPLFHPCVGSFPRLSYVPFPEYFSLLSPSPSFPSPPLGGAPPLILALLSGPANFD